MDGLQVSLNQANLYDARGEVEGVRYDSSVTLTSISQVPTPSAIWLMATRVAGLVSRKMINFFYKKKPRLFIDFVLIQQGENNENISNFGTDNIIAASGNAD